ncbi:MAG: tRNA glutamyl-Q(34) synthetase GluQRS [Gammaproteobacteria bacterium]
MNWRPNSVIKPDSHYVGRFAPSPTGPLHFGSAVAAVASYLQARSSGGHWLVRIEDIDPPRESEGASAAILKALVALGLEWDGEVLYQSHMSEAYDEALAQLRNTGSSFPCACTRKQLRGSPYPGTCREGLAPGSVGRSTRVRVDHSEIKFLDELQGSYSQRLDKEVGDFILRRADRLYSYHLAVVVDDAAAGITEIVRGVDLLDSTPRQIYLQKLLGLYTPQYVHIPVVLNDRGAKLSKQTFAHPIDPHSTHRVLCEALRFLGQRLPPGMIDAKTDEIIKWALANWDLSAVGRVSRAHAATDFIH